DDVECGQGLAERRRRRELGGVPGRGLVEAQPLVGRGELVDARRIESDMVEERLARLPGIAVRIVTGHPALVAPPDVDARPVDGVPVGVLADGRERVDAETAARQRDRELAELLDDLSRALDEAPGVHREEGVPVGMHDDTGLIAHASTVRVFASPSVSTRAYTSSGSR